VVDLARPRVALAAGRRQGPRVPGPCGGGSSAAGCCS
jgi:hypothetical protein